LLGAVENGCISPENNNIDRKNETSNGGDTFAFHNGAFDATDTLDEFIITVTPTHQKAKTENSEDCTENTNDDNNEIRQENETFSRDVPVRKISSQSTAHEEIKNTDNNQPLLRDNIEYPLPVRPADNDLDDRVPPIDTKNFVHVDINLEELETPFHRHDSIIKDQLFEIFGMDPQGNFVRHIYEDIPAIMEEDEDNEDESVDEQQQLPPPLPTSQRPALPFRCT